MFLIYFWNLNETGAFLLLFVFMFSSIKVQIQGRARWLMPIIPAVWEAEVRGSQGQEFESSLVDVVKPRLY